VVVDGEMLASRGCRDARRMLARLSGRQHQVITGICLRRGAEVVRDCAATKVWFAPMSAREIEEYVASGEPMDKAGAYAIQGLASKFIERIDGCYFNVVACRPPWCGPAGPPHTHQNVKRRPNSPRASVESS